MTHKVNLCYHKQSGKFYSDGSYATEHKDMYAIRDEIRTWQQLGTPLPGLSTSGREFYIHVTVEEPNNFGFPILLIPFERVVEKQIKEGLQRINENSRYGK